MRGCGLGGLGVDMGLLGVEDFERQGWKDYLGHGGEQHYGQEVVVYILLNQLDGASRYHPVLRAPSEDTPAEVATTSMDRDHASDPLLNYLDGDRVPAEVHLALLHMAAYLVVGALLLLDPSAYHAEEDSSPGGRDSSLDASVDGGGTFRRRRLSFATS